MAIRFTKRAERSIERIDDWWRVDRRSSPDLFWQELNAAIDTLRTFPEAGIEYKTRRGNTVRRLLLERSKYRVYYELRDQDVFILLVWGATRERGPKL